MIWYLSHPEVDIDPAIPVPDWGLSTKGRARVSALAARGWPQGAITILTSPEAKARETAEILAAPRGLAVKVVPGSGEVDRSSTGYVPHARHEALADRLFADPDASAEGWETARMAQARVVSALHPYLTAPGKPVLIVGHGGVGTFLWCHVARLPISRALDQRGGGCAWAACWQGTDLHPLHPWTPMEAVANGRGLDAHRGG